MKDMPSQHDSSAYIKRRLSAKLRGMASSFPVTVLTGARQVGKSTLLRNDFPDFAYLTLDDFDVRARARSAPQSLWDGIDRIVIDEAQKEPALLDAVKKAVDDSGRKRRFILSGSANLLLMEKVTESLAGRAVHAELFPMTHGEERGVVEPANFHRLLDATSRIVEKDVGAVDPVPFLLRGFMPPTLELRSATDVLTWLEGYVRTYLERDLRELTQVDSLVDFRRVMKALSLRSGNLLNQVEVARDSGTTQPTAHRYIRLLEVSNLFHRLPAYQSNRTTRLIKSPKIHPVDPAIAVFLSDYFDAETLKTGREVGGFFESLVGLHLRVLCESMTPRAGLFHWRTSGGAEVDFIVEHGRRVAAFEVKMTTTPGTRDCGNLLKFLADHPSTVRGVLVHAGGKIVRLHDKIVAVPWWWLDG